MQPAVFFNVCIVGPDIHKFADVAAAFADGIALEEFPDLVKQHYCNGFRIVAAFFVQGQGDGADGRYGHQEAFIEYLSVFDSFGSFDKYVIADHKVRDEIQPEPEDPGYRGKGQACEKACGNDDPCQHFFLFFVHGVPPSV